MKAASEQRTQLSCAQTPDPQKLWDNKCMLFQATKPVVNCRAIKFSIENEYISFPLIWFFQIFYNKYIYFIREEKTFYNKNKTSIDNLSQPSHTLQKSELTLFFLLLLAKNYIKEEEIFSLYFNVWDQLQSYPAQGQKLHSI